MHYWKRRCCCALALGVTIPFAHAQSTQIGREVAIPEHLQNGHEYMQQWSNYPSRTRWLAISAG